MQTGLGLHYLHKSRFADVRHTWVNKDTLLNICDFLGIFGVPWSVNIVVHVIVTAE